MLKERSFLYFGDSGTFQHVRNIREKGLGGK
jgi:hypothetical protein